MAGVRFRGPGDTTEREAVDADPEECSLRDRLVGELERYVDAFTVVLCRTHDQPWELESIDPNDDDARFRAASVIARVAGVRRRLCSRG